MHALLSIADVKECDERDPALVGLVENRIGRAELTRKVGNLFVGHA
jgi:hypothetical protein